MSEFSLELATPADDPAIRRLLAAIPMPGSLEMTYEREPDYFRGCGVLSPFYQVVVARYRPTGELVAVAGRSVRQVYVNGEPVWLGYLSQLRVDPRFRARWLVSRGFRLMRDLHGDGRVQAYLSTIIDGNDQATGILVDRPRRHFPAFRAVGDLRTLALFVRRSREAPSGSSAAVRPAVAADLPAVAAFLERHGRRRQFFPVLTAGDLASGRLTPDLAPQDWLIAQGPGGAIAGVVALWDQTGFKQNVIRGYHGPYRLGRPLYNLWARLSGRQPLPAPGTALRELYAAFLCVAEEDPATCRALLDAGCREAATRGFGYLLVGLSEQDPLLPTVSRYRHAVYRSTLYTAAWNDGGEFHDRLDARIPYVEIASL